MYKIIGADLKEYGPVSADQLRQWLIEGRVNAQTKVQAADSTEWKALGELPEFAALLPKAPPPPLRPAPIAPLSAHPKNSPMAVWAMVAGIGSMSVCCCLWFILAPLAIILGAVALSNLKSHPELTGRGFAIAAIVLGVIALIVNGLGFILVMTNPDYMQRLQNALPHQ